MKNIVLVVVAHPDDELLGLGGTLIKRTQAGDEVFCLILGEGSGMEFKDCIKFANENPVSYIATVDGDQPRVRAFLMWFADESGFYYHTGTAKSVYKQLKNNPRV